MREPHFFWIISRTEFDAWPYATLRLMLLRGYSEAPIRWFPNPISHMGYFQAWHRKESMCDGNTHFWQYNAVQGNAFHFASPPGYHRTSQAQGSCREEHLQLTIILVYLGRKRLGKIMGRRKSRGRRENPSGVFGPPLSTDLH